MKFMRDTLTADEYEAYCKGIDAILGYLFPVGKAAAVNQTIADKSDLEQQAQIFKGMAKRKVQQSDTEIDAIKSNMAIARALVARGVNKHNLNMIERSYVEYATVCARQIKLDRIYTAIGLTCREKLKFGRDRTLAFMHYFDDLCGKVAEDDVMWAEYMDKLCTDLGIVTQSGDIDMPKYLREFNPDVILEEETESDKSLGR